MDKKWIVLAWALSCFSTAGANAAIIQFTERVPFEGALGAFTVEDFEGFAPQVDAFEGLSFDFGDFSAQNGTNIFSGGDIGPVPDGFPEFGSTIVIWGAAFIGAATFELTFDAPITAIGFDSGELADQRVDHLEFDNAAGDVVALSDASGALRFYGFVSDTPFTTFTISLISLGAGQGDGDGFTIDNLTYGTVPEPSTSLLLALAVGGTVIGRRKAVA